MLRPTIRHRTVQPRDSGRLAPPTERTVSHGGRPSIPTHNYAIFPISLTRHPPRVSGTGGVNLIAGTGQLPNCLMPYRTLNTTLLKITATQYHRLITNNAIYQLHNKYATHSKYQHDSHYVNLRPCFESIRLQYHV